MTINAQEIVGTDLTFEAAADLSTKQYYAVKLDSNGQVVVAGDGEAAIGVLQNKPAAAGRAASVRVSGITHWIADGAIAVGAKVASSADGQAATAASSEHVVGRFLGTVAAAAGDWAPVLLTQEGVLA